MNLNMIRPKNVTEDFLLSITKNCQTLIEQTHKKPPENLEFKMTKSRQSFRFNPPIQTEGDWMIGFIDLEVYNFFFNITEGNKNIKLYKFLMKKLVVLHMKKLERRLRKTWIFQILQLPICKIL